MYSIYIQNCKKYFQFLRLKKLIIQKYLLKEKNKVSIETFVHIYFLGVIC